LIGHLAGWLISLIGECAQQCQMQLQFQSVPHLDHKKIPTLTLRTESLTPDQDGYTACVRKMPWYFFISRHGELFPSNWYLRRTQYLPPLLLFLSELKFD